jgi:hypothetical protein
MAKLGQGSGIACVWCAVLHGSKSRCVNDEANSEAPVLFMGQAVVLLHSRLQIIQEYVCWSVVRPLSKAALRFVCCVMPPGATDGTCHIT